MGHPGELFKYTPSQLRGTQWGHWPKYARFETRFPHSVAHCSESKKGIIFTHLSFKVVNMDNIRAREGRGEHNTREVKSSQYVRTSMPNGFEGMNFEQQRGHAQNDRDGRVAERSERETSGEGEKV